MGDFCSTDLKEIRVNCGVGFWKLEIVDGEAKRMCVDQVMENLMGLPKGTSPEDTCTFFTSHIHPDDLKITADFINSLMEGESEITYRYLHPTKGEIQVRCCGKIFKKENNIIQISGYHRELVDIIRFGGEGELNNQLVRQNRNLEIEQKLTEQYGKDLVDRAGCGIVYYSLPERDDIFMNAEALRVYGLKDKKEIKDHLKDITNRVSYPTQKIKDDLIALREKDGIVDYEYKFSREDGTILNLIARTEVITTPKGKRATYTTFIDVSDVKELQNEKNILSTLCSNFLTCYFLDFKNNTIKSVKSTLAGSGDYGEGQVDSLDSYFERMKIFYKENIKKEDDDFLEKLSPSYIKEYLKTNSTLDIRFSLLPVNDVVHHLEITISKGNDELDTAVMGFRLIDDIIVQEEKKKEELEKINKKLEAQLATIGSLSNAFFAVYLVNVNDLSCRSLKNIDQFAFLVGDNPSATDVAKVFIQNCVMDEDKEKMIRFVDFSSCVEKLKKVDVINEKFHGSIDPFEWCRARWVVSSRDSEGNPLSILFTVEDITQNVLENKKREQEKMLLQEQQNIINGLSKDYTTVWFVKNNGRTCIKYQDSGRDDITRKNGFFLKEEFDYEESIEYYSSNFVNKEDVEKFKENVAYEKIIKMIKLAPVYNVVYRRIYEGKEEFYQISYALASSKGEENNFVMGFKNVDDVVLSEKTKNEKLQQALEAAKEASAAKTRFLNNMSHDIRTPMNAILGYNKLMRKELTDEKLISYQEKIENSGNLLLSIINNILDMSRIESGKMELEEEPISINEINEEISGVFEQEASKKDIIFNSSINVKHDIVLGDATKIKEIIVNLVSNSIKYTKEGGEVSFKIEEENENKDGYAFFKITVKDNGIGMSKDFIPTIFDSFSRERNSTIGKVIGTGLGMSIVKKLVDMMQGTITVNSEEGVGSEFIVVLKQKIALESSLNKVHKIYTKKEKDALIKGKNILLAEDNALNAEIAITILEEMGVMVTHAENGLECFNKLKENNYDLILMDIQMPVMNGYEACQNIRKLEDKNKASIPIVAMTANAFEEDKKLALKNGMNAHISKPIEIYKLEEIMINIFEKKNNK